MTEQFKRIEKDSMLGGVCTGLAEYFETDVTLIRVMFVVIALFTVFPMILLYIILWIVAPSVYQKDKTLDDKNQLG